MVTVTGTLVIDKMNYPGTSITGITAGTNGLGTTGNAGTINVQATNLVVRNHGAIDSDTQGGAMAGIVAVKADSILIQADGIISSGSFGSGAGRQVTVTGKNIVLDGADSHIFTGITAQADSSGNAGAVIVNADSLRIINDSEISSTTFSSGRGGSVTVTANNLTLDKKGFITSASILSGPAGIIDVHVDDNLRLTQSQITSQSLQVSGGGVMIFAGKRIDLTASKISAQAHGEGGTIFITCPGTIDLQNKSKILTKAGANGGNITIDPSFVILENSQISANGGINGGNITVRPNWLLESQSSITATGTRGVGGTLQITPDYNLTGALLSLPVALSDSLTLQPQCAADLPGLISSFIVTCRGGQPLTPGGWTPDLELRLPARP